MKSRAPSSATPGPEPADRTPARDPSPVGKTTRVAGHGPTTATAVQCKIESPGANRGDPAQLHAIAARGVEAATAELPHRHRIEELFGRPITARAALGDEAKTACDALGAKAYARGDQVAFASPSPDLHLAAHEAAHTLQQRGGVQLADGLGRAGDHHEQIADEAADRVVHGRSAAELFDDTPAQRSSAPAIQRVILASAEPTEADVIDSASKVDARPEFQGVSAGQRARLIALATNEDSCLIAEALERTRNTVVAAVDGTGGAREGQFLANAWQKRGHVTAYDPAMHTGALRDMLGKHGVPSNTSTLSPSSITSFGQHVPYTDVFVPHPGPWIGAAPPGDLASCLDQVLGPSSRAFVVTDNETAQGYANTLQQRIQSLNTQHAQTVGYRPLASRIEVIVPQITGEHFKTQVDGIELELGHQPNYRLVIITRT